MRVRLLAPESGNETRHDIVSFLVDETVAVNAGFIGFYRTPHDQARVRHLLLSNTRACNCASLAIFVENAFEPVPECVTVHAHDQSLESVKTDIFNDRIWPDFFALSTPKARFLEASRVVPGRPFEVDGKMATGLEARHPVATLAWHVESEGVSALFLPDSAPTPEIWEFARSQANLQAIFATVSHPDSQRQAAEAAMATTPERLAEFAAETDGASVYALVSSRVWGEEIRRDLGRTDRIRVAEAGEYDLA